MNKIPFLFFRFRTCNEKNGLTPNISKNRRMTAVVKWSGWDCKHYDSSWMNDEDLSIHCDSEVDYTMVPDVDLTKESFVFDSDDAAKNERDAIEKMKELWAKVGAEE